MYTLQRNGDIFEIREEMCGCGEEKRRVRPVRHDYEGVDKSTKPFPPYVAVNTTAGTGSEMTRFCIITDLSRHVKMAIVDWRCTPTIAIDDPVLMDYVQALLDRKSVV